jgi:hypothetical protein
VTHVLLMQPRALPLELSDLDSSMCAMWMRGLRRWRWSIWCHWTKTCLRFKTPFMLCKRCCRYPCKTRWANLWSAGIAAAELEKV